jgi:ADP-heptose:LPS heptosyltransferase
LTASAAPAGRPLLVVLRALGLGDLLVAVPALRGLARAFPGHRRVLLAPKALEPLALASGAVDAVVALRAPLVPGRGAFEPAPATLADPGSTDVAVNLHGRGPDSHRVLLALRPRRLLAFAHPLVPASLTGPAFDGPDGEHERARWCRLLAAHGIAADPLDLALPRPSWPGPVPPGWSDGATVVHPGAASPGRRWPPERFAAVARAEAAAGRPVVVTGSAAEAGLAAAVARRAGLAPAAVLAGRTSLAELAALVARAGTVVSGDTGVAHLATAYGTPSVVLFGPVPPSRWGPPPGLARHVALWAGRTGSPWAAEPDGGLAELSTGAVLEALRALDRAAPGR